MDICMVCLDLDDDGDDSRIHTESVEWNKYNVQRIIEKHIWWWHCKTKNGTSIPKWKWICQQCWQQLWSFHTFYMRVEKTHNLYYSSQFSECIILTEYNTEEKPKIAETQDENNCAETSLTEDLIPLTKRKRGRPCLENEDLEFITIGDVCVDEVKNEIDSNASLDTIKDFEDDYRSCGSSDSKQLSEDEAVNRPANKKRRTTCKKVVRRKEKSTEGTSSVQITKKYDDFIAQNHDFFCSICHVPLTDFQNLIVHFRDEHNTKAFAMCCGKKFYKRAVFVDHLYVHKDPEYFKCQHCGKVLSNRRCLKNHLEWHDVTRKPKFNCEDCGKDFFRRGSLEKHKLLHVPEEERHFQCTECEKKFASASLRTQHLKVTHLNKYAKICDICGKPFRERHSFQRHLAEHTGVPTVPYACDLCGMQLTSIYGLNRHKRLRHTEENMQEQICPYCSKASPNIAAHRSHIQYSHTMKRKHACHLCEKAFRRPKELKEHLSTHTGEALYTCPHCPRTFISNANMHKHRKNEHPKEWEEARLKRLSSHKISVSESYPLDVN